MRLELTRKTDYAVRAMLALARHPGETLSSADISELTNIPVRFVTQVMGNLVRAGLAHGVIGRSGGYRLSADPAAVSVLSIVEAVEGDTRRQHCVLRGGPCQYEQQCEIHYVFGGAQEAFINTLAASSLADIAEPPDGPGGGLPPRDDARPGRQMGSRSSDAGGSASAGAVQEEISIRRVRPADRDRLIDFYASLSADSRHARFLGYVSGLRDDLARSFCTPDHMHDEGFVALAGAEAQERLVGHLCLQPAGRRRLELALAVADEYHGRGIGRRLLETALAWARDHSIEAIIASAFADNFRVLRLLSSAPYPVHISPADGGVVDIVMPLVPELLPDRPVVLPAALRASRRHGRRRRAVGSSRCSRVVWRGTRQPGRGAGDSASTRSS